MKLTFTLIFLALATLGQAAERPNVIVIMTDDQGYGDLSCHGNPVLRTPHLDHLHSESVRLTDFHAAPMCTPTRGQFLTGIDAARNGAINVSSGRTLLRRELPTIADMMADAGYRTGIFGKWHLGDNYPYRPEDRGFEETLWFPSSHINSTPDVWNNDYFDDTYRRNGELTEYKGYCTDVFFDEAIEWMKSRAEADEPFFTYLPTNAPHSPYWLPQSYRDAMTEEYEAAEAAGTIPKKVPPAKRDDLIDFLAMIRNVDDNVGKLETFLTESGIADNTIVIYLTDNGSTLGEFYFNAGMRGKKTQLWEGGHRVPCFVRWPNGEFGKARDLPGLTQSQDLLPTVLDLCNIEADTSFDGISLAPMLQGKADIPEERMLIINYSRMPFSLEYPTPDSPSRMVREGAGVLWKHWRLLEDKELYDLSKDPSQKRNVIAKHAIVAKKMSAHLDQWWDDVREIANEPQPTVIGHEAENPMMLTACEWLDVFVDQQSQIREGIQNNSWWEIEVAEAGEYEFELRRWPRDADLPINAPAPETVVTDATLGAGKALPIVAARMQVGTQRMPRRRLEKGAKSITFNMELPAGRTRLYTWFDGEDRQPIVGAYYVYVNRK